MCTYIDKQSFLKKCLTALVRIIGKVLYNEAPEYVRAVCNAIGYGRDKRPKPGPLCDSNPNQQATILHVSCKMKLPKQILSRMEWENF